LKGNKFILENGLYICWFISLVATGGSLYFSDVVGYPPCTYCWYQRILMYPNVILLGIAAVRRDHRQVLYTLPLSVLGIGMSSFHYLTQKTGLLKTVGHSCGIIPCDTTYINWFGFITIPFLALTAFVLLTIMQILILRAMRRP
jgi:disulfide bond formation protein DsbB